ncbi:hypothetical protein [Poriferisphaera sp. WC338]|uniref:hypothetical protein n=1 Tax=Poriferisphaera sp. WC338 TaxID=3425129 RepID=UPI003D81868B
MGTSSDLLRMLEPAVRPVPVQVKGTSQQSPTTFENKTFDQLLDEARTIATGPEADQVKGAEGESKAVDSLSPLTRIDLVENAALRQILEAKQDQLGNRLNQPTKAIGA